MRLNVSNKYEGDILSQNKSNIIVIDDDEHMREMLQDYLKSLDHSVIAFQSAVDALKAINGQNISFPNNEEPDLIITDLNMPDLDGIGFIKQFKRQNSSVPIILITAFGCIDTAIEATRAGAYSYILKPFKLIEFEVVVDRALSHNMLTKENSLLRSEIQKNWSHGKIIGKSKAMTEVFDLISRVASAKANVLISGESGTGKEMIAKDLHAQSCRSDKPFVAVNCAAIPDSLLESELFGHVKGSFTGAISDKKGLFEEAENGTIFLDEIGDLDLSLQAKILRVLQEREIKPIGSCKSKKIDIRIVAATHKDLKKAVKEKRFREDLYYRLSVIPIALPPLRERQGDVPILANYFLRKYAAVNKSPAIGFTPSAMECLLKYKWEGNVRELENLVERVVVLSNNKYIDSIDIPPSEIDTAEDFYLNTVSDWPTLEQIETRYINTVLNKVGGKKEQAAQILGINRRTLYRREQDGLISSSV